MTKAQFQESLNNELFDLFRKDYQTLSTINIVEKPVDSEILQDLIEKSIKNKQD